MKDIIQKKRQLIELLQKYTNWGKGEEEAQRFRNFLENEGINGEHEEENSQTSVLLTKILIDTDKIVSPIHLDSNVELPVVELFIDNNNFLIFTTEFIYNCRNCTVQQIKYKNIVCVDENSLNNYYLNKKKKDNQFFDIELIILNDKNAPITVEYGISFRPIVHFLTMINEQNK